MELEFVNRTYRRWAPIYDVSFGGISRAARRAGIALVNDRGGSVLEVGVGTGLSLPHYTGNLRVTGIDFSEDMLAHAREKVEQGALSNVAALRQMDARRLDFADESFDTVVAMFLVSVAPEPERVMAEMSRVCRPGGEVIVVNHFARDHGVIALAERSFARFDRAIGWHSDFRIDHVLGAPGLTLVENRALWPLGLFSLLRFRKDEAGSRSAAQSS
jgi:phosphatidylethanolamine/phosphatidyl-N-methylethanolamine N-methyltransferase